MLLYRYFHFLSLDIVLGAAASGYLASRVLDVKMGSAWWVALSLTVWILYLLDHWLDAKRYGTKSPRNLHGFFRHNSATMLYLLIATSIADILIIFVFLQKELLLPGIILGGSVVIIYIIRHNLKVSRFIKVPFEFLILVFYVAGIWFGPIQMTEIMLTSSTYLIIAEFGVMIFMNVTILSYYDYPLDMQLKSLSMAKLFGRRSMLPMAWISGIIVTILMVWIVMSSQNTETLVGSVVIAGMGFLLLFMLLFPSKFEKNERYRIAGDAILFLGWIMLLI